MIGCVTLIILVAAGYYGGKDIEAWLRIFPVILLILIAFITKKWRIKRKAKEIDERLQMITYYALSVGFYSILGVLFWFYTEEMVQEGALSLRTQMEMYAGLLGYLGAYFYFKKRF